MKTTLTALIALILALSCYSQSNPEDIFYLWNSKWENVPVADSAVYFTRVKKVDTSWQFDTYNFAGPMITSEQFKDRNGEILNGRSSYFRPNGTLDSIGRFHNGKQHGDWYYYNDSGTVWVRKEYAFGELKVVDEPKRLDPNPKKADSNEVESMFPGPNGAWSRYLSKNMKYPEKAHNSSIQGTVVVTFIIDAEGRIEEAHVFKSAEFSLDEETLRLIRKSPRWKPAVQFGKKVKSYKRQPLIFKLE